MCAFVVYVWVGVDARARACMPFFLGRVSCQVQCYVILL